jgi:hypothetical protein
MFNWQYPEEFPGFAERAVSWLREASDHESIGWALQLSRTVRSMVVNVWRCYLVFRVCKILPGCRPWSRSSGSDSKSIKFWVDLQHRPLEVINGLSAVKIG